MFFTVSKLISRVCTDFEVFQCLFFLDVLTGLDRLRHSGRAGAGFVRAVAPNYPTYLEGAEPFPPVPRRGGGGGGGGGGSGGEQHKEEEESSGATAKNENNAANDTQGGNTGGRSGGGGTSTKADKNKKKKTATAPLSKLLARVAKKRALAAENKQARAAEKKALAAENKQARAAEKQAREAEKKQLAAEKMQARAAEKQARAAEKKKARAEKSAAEAEKKQERAEKSAAEAAEKAQLKLSKKEEQKKAAKESGTNNKGKNNGRPGSTINLTAAAASAAPSVVVAAVAEAPANNEARFLSDLLNPKPIRYDWEEVHPALALSSGSPLVVDAPRSGRLRPSAAALRLGTMLESCEAFSTALSVAFWVSLGAAACGAGVKAFDVLELLSVAF